MELNDFSLIWAALGIGVLGIIFVLLKMRQVLAFNAGNETMREIASAIQAGAAGFLRDEYRILAIFVAVVTVAMALLMQWQSAASFLLGAVTSAGAGYLGMYVAVRANVRTAAASSQSLNAGLRVAFGSGSIMGMSGVWPFSTSCSTARLPMWLALGSVPAALPCLPGSAAASSPRQPMSEPIWSARWNRAFPRTIPAIRQ